MTGKALPHTEARDRPVRVGLVGAGPWARSVHAPTFAGGPETELVGVWSRNRADAEQLAATYPCRVFRRIDDLMSSCELVSFAVSPAAQATLAGHAALAGRPMLLEKPLAPSLETAIALTDALAARRVASMMFLTYRFSPLVAAFLASCRARSPVGARMAFHTTTHISQIAGWRREHGLLLDLGFHVFDLLESAAGRITRVAAHGDSSRWVGVLIDHAGGCISEASISWSGLAVRRTELEVFTDRAGLALDPRACVRGEWLGSGVRRSVRALVRDDGAGAATERIAGVEHGLHLQRCVDAAQRSLRSGGHPVDIDDAPAQP